MDCRNCREPAPEVQDGKYLEKMFDLQKELMEGYIKIEGLPRYPLNINSKNAQVVLKDMASRSVEELAEGYESTHLACEIVDKYGWNINLIPPKEYDMLLNHLQNSNEEQADATAFYLELLIYAGVTPEDLREYALTKMDDLDRNLKEGASLLELLMTLGVKLLHEFNPYMLEVSYDNSHRYPLIDLDRLSLQKEREVEENIAGFRELSQRSHHNEMSYLWQIQYHLGVGRNYLKNKPWKQSQELSDEELYFEHLYQGFFKLMGYLAIMGFTPESLYNIFWKKHCINKFRQTSNY